MSSSPEDKQLHYYRASASGLGLIRIKVDGKDVAWSEAYFGISTCSVDLALDPEKAYAITASGPAITSPLSLTRIL